MLILAFESSARAASVALLRDGRLLGQSTQISALTHSRTLLPMAEDLLRNCELKPGDVDLFAVAQGPGSFTGIRIGVSRSRASPGRPTSPASACPRWRRSPGTARPRAGSSVR